jgi:uncharacterized membrane protein YeaQ/YmgE (transglycosylase-associated protein family)
MGFEQTIVGWVGGCVGTYLFDFLITHGSKFLNKFHNGRIISFGFFGLDKISNKCS